MKKFLILLLLILLQNLPAQTNRDIAIVIIQPLIELNIGANQKIIDCLIEDIVIALDTKDEAIDYNASIALQWKTIVEKQKKIWWGINAGIKLNDFFPTIGFIILF
jgi:hypothetical protein